jgi:hypothetical protein
MPMYAAHARFDPFAGARWQSFIQWSGFNHVSEVVSTDGMLCPNLVAELLDEDWKHNIQEDCKTSLFHDLHYLMDRVCYDPKQHNLLSLVQAPQAPVLAERGFEFCGYDILDEWGSVSVLTNCGGFPDIFPVSELNRCALLSDFARAQHIAKAIRAANPDEPHCGGCRVWSLCRRL